MSATKQFELVSKLIICGCKLAKALRRDAWSRNLTDDRVDSYNTACAAPCPLYWIRQSCAFSQAQRIPGHIQIHRMVQGNLFLPTKHFKRKFIFTLIHNYTSLIVVNNLQQPICKQKEMGCVPTERWRYYCTSIVTVYYQFSFWKQWGDISDAGNKFDQKFNRLQKV